MRSNFTPSLVTFIMNISYPLTNILFSKIQTEMQQLEMTSFQWHKFPNNFASCNVLKTD